MTLRGWWKRLASSPQRRSEEPRSSEKLDAMGDWVVSWCRLLNAFPDIEDTLAFAAAAKERTDSLIGKWFHQRGKVGYILVGESFGRFSPHLPDGVQLSDGSSLH